MFSHDGTRLAIGGGSWYGAGGILVHDLASGAESVLACASLPEALRAPNRFGPTVSGVCFSPDDRHLIATTWSASHRIGPTLVFAVTGVELVFEGHVPISYSANTFSPAPTGLNVDGARLVVRHYNAPIEDVVSTLALPSEVDRSPSPRYLTGHRVAICGDEAITGSHGLRTEDGAGLVVAGLDSERPRRLVATREQAPVTAVGATTSPTELVTGTRDGALDRWRFDADWQRTRLRPPTEGSWQPVVAVEVTWATYTWRSVVAICSLAGGDRMACATAGGELTVWDRADPSGSMQSVQLRAPGTPRSIAAHPDMPLVAVGVKQGHFDHPRSCVALCDLERPPITDAMRTPRVIAVARLHQRSNDLTTLGVLADALEDLGADVRILHHLRHHEPRPTRCWVIEELIRGAV